MRCTLNEDLLGYIYIVGCAGIGRLTVGKDKR